MFSISKNSNENYLAKILKLSESRPHTNSDNLAIAIVDNHDIVYNKNNFSIGETIIFFPVGAQISNHILTSLNMYSDKELNNDQTKTGYFSKNGLVKTKSIRGVPSMGLIIKASEVLDLFDVKELDVKDDECIRFDTITFKDKESIVCQKYVPKEVVDKAPRNGMECSSEKRRDKTPIKEAKFQRLLEDQFKFHVSTAHLRNVIDFVPTGQYSITRKLHGTSFILGRVLTKKKTQQGIIGRWWTNLTSWWNKRDTSPFTIDYGDVYSSRTVIRNKYSDAPKTRQELVEGNDIYGIAYVDYKSLLENGYTIYGELVGYMPSGKAIQSMGGKDYDYGCVKPNGDSFLAGVHYKFYIYNITYTNQTGNSYCVIGDFADDGDTKYLASKDFNFVPKLGIAEVESNRDWSINNQMMNKAEILSYFTSAYLTGNEPLCRNLVPIEGIVLVNPLLKNYVPYKLISQSFKEKEIVELDKGIVDTETLN